MGRSRGASIDERASKNSQSRFGFIHRREFVRQITTPRRSFSTVTNHSYIRRRCFQYFSYALIVMYTYHVVKQTRLADKRRPVVVDNQNQIKSEIRHTPTPTTRTTTHQRTLLPHEDARTVFIIHGVIRRTTGNAPGGEDDDDWVAR